MLTALVGLWAALTVWAHQGYDLNDQWNRLSWGWVGVAGVMMLALGMRGEWAKAALLGWAVYTLMVTTPLQAKQPRSKAWEATGISLLALVGGYLLWPSLQIETRWLLGGMAVMGLPVTLWGWYSWQHATGQYQYEYGPFWLYDESNICPRAGQGKANHAQSVIVLSIAAVLAMAVTGSVWWLVLLPGHLFGVWVCRDHRGYWLTQGVVQVGLLLVAAGLWEVLG